MTEARRNFEIKVRCSEAELARIRAAAVQSGFTGFHFLRQRDTYFVTSAGRLKLREIEGEPGERTAELIAYSRPDEDGARWSRYHQVQIAPEDADALREGLASTLGERIVISKRREVGLRRAMRLHLDLVDSLGGFVELERVSSPSEETTAEAEMAEIVRELGLDRFEVVAGSYADLVERD